MRLWKGLSIAIVAVVPHGAAAADGAWRVGLGGEWDSNASRQTGDDVESAFGTRFYGQVRGAVDAGNASRLRGSVALAGRVIAGDAGEDSLAAQLQLSSTHSLAGIATLGTSVDMRERVEWPSTQDYRLARGDVRFTVPVSIVDLWVSGGGDVFWFKPDDSLSYVAPQASAGIVVYPHDSWTISADWSRQWREFDETSEPDALSDEPVEPRHDNVDVAAISVKFSSGVWRAAASWQFRHNASTIDSRGYVRQGGEFSLAWVTWDDLLLTASASLQQTRFDEGVYVDVSTNIDDEDRNSVAIAAEYPVIDHLSVEARAMRLGQSFGTLLPTYDRWVVYLGVGSASR